MLAFMPMSETGSASQINSFSCLTASPTISWIVSSVSLLSSIEYCAPREGGGSQRQPARTRTRDAAARTSRWRPAFSPASTQSRSACPRRER
eukprot:3475900-Prymnesium_polylepis.1